MIDKSDLTEWSRKLKSPDQAVKQEAAKRISEAFTEDLLRRIKKRLGRKVRRRADEEDVLQSAFKSFFVRNPSFANRNVMFAYLVEIAIHKAANVVRHHHRQVRDIRKEVEIASATSDGEDDHDPLEAGIKPVARGKKSRRPYQTALPIQSTQPAQDDSFFSEGTLEQMLHGGQPKDVAELCIDLNQCLEEFDAQQSDQLSAIVRHRLEDRTTAEIAKELGISKRTVERKLELIAELWDKSKTIRVEVEGDSEPESRLADVLPRTTAAVLLNRLGLSRFRLTRLVKEKPGRSFAPSDELYGLIADRDILLERVEKAIFTR